MVDTTKKTVLIVFSVAIVCLIIGLTVGLSLHFTLNNDDKPVPVARQAAVGDCWPQNGGNETICSARGCQWIVTSDGAPNCTFPAKYGYEVQGSPPVPTASGFEVSLSRIATPSLFGNDVTSMRVSVTYETNSRLHIKFTDAEKVRYEVPKEALNITYDSSSPPSNETRLYDVTWLTEPRFGLRVTRRSTGFVIFDTTTPGFVFSDQYIQLTVALQSDNVYGFGEHNHKQFKHNMNWKKWTIFTRDEAPVGDWNLYGAQPMYMNLESDGNANGVFLLNSNAMDIVLQPNPYPAITYHVIGGILDFYIFLGPTPENVVQQYTEAVGRPLMPPYWALGFQLSRWDYDNLTYAKYIVDRNYAAGIPQDVQFGDVDYMESKLLFTYDKQKYSGLPEFVDVIHQRGQKYIILLDHGVGSDKSVIQQQLNGTYLPLSDGEERRIFIFDPRNKSQLLYGEVWPGEAVYPDFTLGENVTSWWTTHCRSFWNTTDGDWGVKYDALWIDMNEPSNFIPGSTTGCDRNKWNYPPYMPNILGGWLGHLYEKTICMDAEQHWGRHYDVHSLYGHSMAITSFRTLRTLFPEKRPFVLTRSNFAGTQKHAVHWLGDNQSQWVQMGWSVIGMLEYSLFGFSYTGADICGFWYAATEQMCQRWMQLGAFYPFSRNHNAATWPDQDPAAFSDEMIRVSREILLTRYKLLPFLYTLLHEAHIHGSTVVRPLLHEFPKDQHTMSIDRQFLWGPSFMISPVMDENVFHVNAYFPSGRWYDYYGGKGFDSQGEFRNLSTPLDKIQLHVRAGYIIPWQEPANTTVYSRQNPMGLLVAMEPSPSYQAKGNLFWDDGESFETFESGDYLLVEFQSSASKIEFIVQHAGYSEANSLIFKTIDIWGIGRSITGLEVDGVPQDGTHIRYDSATGNVQLVNLNMTITANHTVTWQSVA